MRKLETLIDSVLQYGDKTYFYDRGYNTIWKSDETLNKIEFLRSAHTDVKLLNFAAFGIFEHEGSIYISSQVSTDIVEYCLKDNMFYHHKFNDKSGNYSNNACVAYKGEIWLLPSNLCSPVLIFDMQSHTYRIDKKISNHDSNRGYVYQDNRYVYIPKTSSNIVYKIALDGAGIEQIVFSDNAKINNVCIVGNISYAMDMKEPILWRKSDEENVGLKLDGKHGNDSYGKLTCCGEFLVALPRKGCELCVYDTKMDKVFEYRIPVDDGEIPHGESSLFYGHYVYRNEIMFLPWAIPEIFVFDMCTRTFTKKKFTFQPNKEWILNWRYLKEEEFGLDDFLSAMIDKREVRLKIEKRELCGEKIYKTITLE